MKEAVNRFVAGKYSAKKNGKHDGDARQILHPSVPIGETLLGVMKTALQALNPPSSHDNHKSELRRKRFAFLSRVMPTLSQYQATANDKLHA
jgi:hypothetical protein